MDTDLLIGAAFFVMAVWVAYKWLSPRPRHQIGQPTNPSSSLQGLLPALGKPGSASKEQKKHLEQHGLTDLDFRALSREQAEFLLDCIMYVTSVWELDLNRESDKLSTRSLENTLRVILEHDSYQKRVIAWNSSLSDDLDLFIPDDACHNAVRYHLSHTI